MFLGIVNRMILSELVKVFLMSLIGLTGMFLLAGLIQEASQRGLSPTQIIMAIPLIIPNTLPFTIPATTLFSTCVVYGRMSADNEVLVLRAAGVNIYRLLTPALVLGLMTTGVTLALFYEPIPRSQQMFREQLLKDSEQILYGMIKREGGMRQPNLDFVMFVRDVQGRDLIDVVVKKRKPDRSGYEFVARSQSAKLRVREVPDDTVRVPPGAPVPVRKELVVHMDRCFVDSQKGDASADLQQQEYAMALPASVFGKDPRDRPSAQTWQELRANKANAIDDIAATAAEIERLKAVGTSPGGSGKDAAREQAAKLEVQLKGKKRALRQLEAEMQQRPALAVGCLCFVLIGCPVGIWASRADYLSVFMICFLPTVMAYYPVSLAGMNMAKDEKAPVYAIWAADAMLFVVALFLIRRLMKR
ncbi:MAG TPA: LptF/LptG family permease [Gemmataceae bacterium]|nr:LptF/LptG family permease [Gemmataceae bacterium]